MTNKELLERCAKVVGIRVDYFEEDGDDAEGMWGDGYAAWNPLTSVADAADMAIKLKVSVAHQIGAIDAWHLSDTGKPYEVQVFITDHPTEQAAYCYAVCSVVAQMGGE